MMNLRQVLEAGASAAFALAHTETHHFADEDEHGLLDPSQALTKKRYRWLDQHYPDKSRWIKDTKISRRFAMAERLQAVTARTNVFALAPSTMSIGVANII
jgi:hypothetical protein